MRKAISILMASTLTLSSVFPNVVYATENISNEEQNINIGVQEVTDSVENKTSDNLEWGDGTVLEGKISKEVDGTLPSIAEEIIDNSSSEGEMSVTPEQSLEREVNIVENNDVYASGTAGTCDWYITNEGELHIGSGELTTLGSGTSFGIWGDYSSNLNKIVFDGPVTSRPELDYLFWRLENVTEIVGLDFLDISGATRTRGMFGHMKSLKSLDVSHFDTSNVWLMSDMFSNIGVESLDISSLDTSNATQLSSLVSNCPNLKKLNAASISIANDVGVYSLFAYNNALEEVDLSSLDLSYVNESTGDLLYRSPIKKLITSEKTRLNSKLELNIPPTNDMYTGKWQTVGIGTDVFPKGDWSGTTEELYERTQEGIADTYVWQPVLAQAEDVTIRYVDEDNKPIADDIVKTGSVGENYTSEQKDIPGYTFKEVQGNPTGQFSAQAQTVVYIYTKDEVISVTGTVIVKYEDDKGNTLSDSLIKSGTVGENYTTEKKDIKGYTFKEVKGNKAGAFTEDTQFITYIYTKDTEESGKDDDENKGPDSKDSGNTNGTPKDDDDYSKVTPSNNNSSKSTTDVKKTKEQSLPKAGEKAEALGIMLGVMLLISVAVFGLLRPKKIK